jgi:aminobenzoyl-glutamate transport protein
MKDKVPKPIENTRTSGGLLNVIERVGNRLPDPVTLFVVGAFAVLICSELAAQVGWSVENPTTGKAETVKSLLSSEGMRWVWQNLVANFTGFAPLGVVLVAMIGIGVAERSGHCSRPSCWSLHRVSWCQR